MESVALQNICAYFVPGKPVCKLHPLGSGHIHTTFKVEFTGHGPIVLQRINTSVFKHPGLIGQNIQQLVNHLKTTKYPYTILSNLVGEDGLIIIDENGSYWRAFPFFENTIAVDSVQSAQQAFEAAKAFGSFLRYLDGLDPKNIKDTIPDFHNLELRFQHFKSIVSDDPFQRKQNAVAEIAKIYEFKDQFTFDFERMTLRIVHNDTKISNVLLDSETGKGVCVIDLDTVMQGRVVTDFGDMIRTFCCTADENEKDLSKVDIDLQIFKSMASGFLSTTKDWLTTTEMNNLLNGGIYIILEQAIRFLSDYLAGDKYYPVKYPDQNLNRTKNQLKLLQCLLLNYDELSLIINDLRG